MGSGREAWREWSTRPFVFGGQEESHMAASVQAQYPATAKGEGGVKGFPGDFFVTRVAEIGPISLF